MSNGHVYGWVPDLPDKRDNSFLYQPGITGAHKPKAMPPTVDLRTTGFLPPIFDQGNLGSCTANALTELFFFVNNKQTGTAFLPSRLFIYYNERLMEGTTSSDSGAALRDGIKSLLEQGACVEYLWPYDITLFANPPPNICYADAQRHEGIYYRSIPQNSAAMMGCLAEGYPFVGGISVYDSFESPEVATSGIVPMPDLNVETMQGGHALLFIGYLTFNGVDYYIGMNSWSADWGMNGFFYIPRAYLEDPGLASDFWMIHVVSTPTLTLSGTQ